MFSKATAILALVASATAHMTLNYPVPYGKATLNSSPLAPGDWPCKQRSGVYDVTTMNQWNAGETKDVSFTGSAVHGGGSCQFSLTTDSNPTEASQWKVIHSVVGGCPSNVSGNIEPEDPNGHNAAIFPVTMPTSMPDGLYTFAWTWLNKVGNREFYMNCAPVQVGDSGATASAANAASALGALPDMFVANLPDTSCSTKENEDFNYPDPGQSLVDGASADLGNDLSGAGCASMTKMGAGNGKIGTPTGGAGAGSSAPAATSAAASAPAVSAPAASSAPGYSAAPIASAAPSAVVSVPGVFAPGASSAPASSAPAATMPVASATPVASAAPSTPATSEDCTPCTNDGAVVCIGTSSFGLCNRGCAVTQALAAGMACTDGTIVAAAAKRSFPRAHLHRRHGS
ncbi:lytic polysaccharide monooxygenase, partial [Didymella exigua CBS 183.55]